DRLDARLRHWPLAVVMRSRDCQQLALRLPHAAAQGLARRRQRLDALRHQLARHDPRRIVARLQARTLSARGRLDDLITRRHLAAAARVGHLGAGLHALSPLAVLARGYAVCWNET